VTPNGKQTLVSFTLMGKYRVVGTFDDQNLLALVHTWVPNPVYGDMLYELRYLNYKDFGGVKVSDGAAHPPGRSAPDDGATTRWRSRSATSSRTSRVAALPVPPEVQKRNRAAGARGIAEAGRRRVAHRGGTHNSLAVDFRDFVTVIEAPL
jgi:hypothetical protein